MNLECQLRETLVLKVSIKLLSGVICSATMLASLSTNIARKNNLALNKEELIALYKLKAENASPGN